MRWSNTPGELGGRLMPNPGDGQRGKMPHYSPEGGGGWAQLKLTDTLLNGDSQDYLNSAYSLAVHFLIQFKHLKNLDSLQ